MMAAMELDGNAATYSVRLRNDLRHFLSSLDAPCSPVDTPSDVLAALDYIHANLLDDRLDVARVCADCGLSNHNVTSTFKRHVGVGMHKYIENQRIALAKRLLRHESLPVLDIAWTVGYHYPETFARAFKRNVGCSASTYRDRMRT